MRWICVWCVTPVRVARQIGHPCPHRRQNIGQEPVDLFFGHTWANTRVIQNVEKKLVIDIEEALLDVVIEHLAEALTDVWRRGLRDRCGGVKEQRPVPVANLMRWGIRLRRPHCSQVDERDRLEAVL